MAENLARIYGTEEDKVNCPFYFKVNEKEHLTDFCEEVIDELTTFGLLEEFHVVGNLGEHMLGNVYLKYSSEEEAEKALKALHGRFYGGRQLTVEYSPVSDFRESRCRQYDEETCNRGGFCNFMHMRPLPSTIRRELEKIRERGHRRRRERSRSRDRSDRGERSSRSSRDDRSSREDRPRDDRPRDDRPRDDRRDERSSRSSRDRGAPDSSAPAEGSSSGRSASQERRDKINEWNKVRDAKLAASGAAEAPPAV